MCKIGRAYFSALFYSSGHKFRIALDLSTQITKKTINEWLVTIMIASLYARALALTEIKNGQVCISTMNVDFVIVWLLVGKLSELKEITKGNAAMQTMHPLIVQVQLILSSCTVMRMA